jgi:hypothetical protein
MLLPLTFLLAKDNDTTMDDNIQDLSPSAFVSLPFLSLWNTDYFNVLFNEAYFQFYIGMDATAYQYNGSTGQLQKRTLLSWQNFTDNRALTQPDLDALPDVPTGRILKTKYQQYISVLGSGGSRHTIQVAFDLSPHTPPVLVELVKNKTDWITVNQSNGTTTPLVTRRWWPIDQPLVSADGQLIRFVSATPPPEEPEEVEGGGTTDPEEVEGSGGSFWWWLFWWWL